MVKSVKNRCKFQTNKNVYFAAHILVTGESSIMSILAYQALFPASLKRGLLAEAGISIYFILFYGLMVGKYALICAMEI